MTSGGHAPKASALVVGIERRGPTQDGLGKEAHRAAEFALWLRAEKICPLDRITLIVVYDEENYRESGDSPSSMLSELQGREDEPEVRVVRNARVEQFSDWDRNRRPVLDDDLFVLFWAGRGLANPKDPDMDVCLLTEDADNQPRHIALRQLLDAVGTRAPSARRVVFVDACRGGITEADLGNSWPVPTGAWSTRAPEDEFIVYAAAHGAAAGAPWPDDDKSFAEVVLDYLRNYQGPQAISSERERQKISFEEKIQQEVTRRWTDRQDAPMWTFYRYQDVPFRVPDDSYLKKPEWDSLLKEVDRIDGGARDFPASSLLWNAYCHAVGPVPANGSRAKPRLDKLGDLIRELRDLKPLEDYLPPPVVVASDFVANLSAKGNLKGLNKWCNEWADAHEDGHKKLMTTREGRPSKLHELPYLSILIWPDGAHYQLKAVLWGDQGVPNPLPGFKWDKVPENEIQNTVEKILKQAGSGRWEKPHDMVVEFVLPRNLLGSPEYTYYARYPVVVRDLDRLLGQGKRSDSRDKAVAKWKNVQEFSPWKSPWDMKIRWYDCTTSRPEQIDIDVAVREDDVLCIGLAVPKEQQPDGMVDGGVPPFLSEAIDAGAPIVIWIEQNFSCKGDHPLPYPRSLGNGCVVPKTKRMIEWAIRRNRNGFSELPYLIYELKLKISHKTPSPSRRSPKNLQSNRPRIGILMEDPTRFWPGYFAWQSPGPQGGG